MRTPLLSRLQSWLKGLGYKGNRLVSLLLSLIMLFVSLLIVTSKFSVLEDIEGSLLDARFELRGAIPASGLVKLVTVDANSIDAIGRWPWDRRILAQLIDEISALGAEVIGLDILFSEPQLSEYQQVLQNPALDDAQRALLEQLAATDDPDTRLMTSLLMAGNVVNGHYFYFAEDRKAAQQYSDALESAVLQSSRVNAVRNKVETFTAVDVDSVRTNLADIALVGEGAGFFNQFPDSDGVVRKAPLVVRYKQDFYPSLALKSLARYLQAQIVVFAEDYGIAQVALNDLVIPTNEQGYININYRGRSKSIPTIPALDVLEGRLPAGYFKDSIVLLGVTAVGVFDSHSAPFEEEFPGLEIQANVIESILPVREGDQNQSIQRNSLTRLIDLLILSVICLALGIMIPVLHRAFSRFVLLLALLGLLLALNYYYFAYQFMWLALLYPLSAAFATFLVLMVYQSLMVEQRYSHVRSAFKHYLSPQLVDQLTAEPELLNFGGEEKELSILFSDIRNFTNLSESLQPQELSRFLQAYMDPMTQCVLDSRGTLDKYIGDAVMAIYGAPVPYEEHARYACISAIKMIEALDHIADTVPELAHLFPISIGIGIHTGTCVVGNLGSSMQFNYTVVGDSVNLASRVEGLTKEYGAKILITEATYAQVKPFFHAREMDSVRVKGKLLPVVLYELLAEELSELEQQWLPIWNQALTDYRQRRFEQARQGFDTVHQLKPDDIASALYISRCLVFMDNPPSDNWDGVYTFTKK